MRETLAHGGDGRGPVVLHVLLVTPVHATARPQRAAALPSKLHDDRSGTGAGERHGHPVVVARADTECWTEQEDPSIDWRVCPAPAKNKTMIVGGRNRLGLHARSLP
jgi:hypothetical protein